jgi:catechol 2,3-dioxygenase-like lactoylglutathione lyase family enzyme
MAAPYRSRLARVFDHVTIRVADLEEASRFYATALAPLGHDEPATDGHFFEWGDLSIAAARDDRPETRRAHLALTARSTAEVDAFWQAAVGEGFRDNGAPGPRPRYHEGYYGAFVLDPAGNNIEAVHHGWEIPHMIDHVFIRVAGLTASRRFYETVLEPLGEGVWADVDGRIGLGGRGYSLWLAAGEPTENLHIAFAAGDNATVDEFHRTAVRAGYRDNGPPGERRYHPGYYGAFVLDPDGNNVEAVCHNR